VEVWVRTLPRVDMNTYAAQHHYLRVWVRPELDVEEVVPQVEVGFDPHVGLAQGYEGHNMEDP
jgi:hypothetical protein